MSDRARGGCNLLAAEGGQPYNKFDRVDVVRDDDLKEKEEEASESL
jgi:hypothetical protein